MVGVTNCEHQRKCSYMHLKKNKLHIKFINKIMLIKFIALQNYHKILPCFALI